MSRVPNGAPYYKVERASTDTINAAFASVLSLATKDQDLAGSYNFGPFRNANYDRDDYYDSDKYGQHINETDDEDATIMTKDDVSAKPSDALTSTGPRALLTLARSRVEQDPLFVDFDQAVVITLTSPAALERSAFERSVSDALTARLLVRGQKLDGQWVTKTGKGFSWRELDAPVLGWRVQYALQDNQLIVANDAAYLSEVLTTNSKLSTGAASQFSEFTVVQPAKVRDDFQSTFERLSVGKGDLFVGNILSLVDSAPSIEKIEMTRSHQAGFMRERLRITLKTARPQNEKATE